jgi:hypothetical protein
MNGLKINQLSHTSFTNILKPKRIKLFQSQWLKSKIYSIITSNKKKEKKIISSLKHVN